MLFVEPFFLFAFLPLVLGAFYLAGYATGRMAALLVLLLASLAFYSGFGAGFFLLLLTSTAINFLVGACLCKMPDSRWRMRRLALGAGLAWNFGALFYFKYLGYFLTGMISGDSSGAVNLAIPVGISFYTFHQAVFLADAYNRKQAVVDYLGRLSSAREVSGAAARYAAFICFFPQLVIGPIVYLGEFAPNIARKTFGRFKRLDVEIGLTLIVIGLFKKLLLADKLAPTSSVVFKLVATGMPIDPVAAWMGVCAYYLQLYFDFSGYSDMAVGLARIFGIRLPINFDSPLRASGIRDFYARWHLTLTRIIVRFLFTPLSVWGTRTAMKHRLGPLFRKMLSAWIPLLVNFLVIGLWHGALYTFVVFGLLHGLWVIIETEIAATRRWKAWARRQPPARLHRYGQALAFLPLMLTFALFASPSLNGFGLVLQSLFCVPDAAVQVGLHRKDWVFVVAGFVIVWLLPNSTELMSRYRPAILTRVNPSTTPRVFAFRWRPDLLWCLILAVMVGFCVHQLTAPVPFLYQGF